MSFERSPAFWLEKLYRIRTGISHDSVGLRKNDEFWARKFFEDVAAPQLTLDDYLASIMNKALWTFQDDGSILKNVLHTSIGAELITNGDFSAWTADNPDGWAVVESPPNSEVRESVAGGQCELENVSATARISQAILTIGETYQLTFDIVSITGTLRVTGWGTSFDYTTAGTKTETFIATTANDVIIRQQTAGTSVIDNVSVKKIGELDGDISGVTMQQTGAYSGDLAGSYDGVDDVIAVANNATLANLTTQAWVFLVNATSLGESNFGIFFQWGIPSNGRHVLRFNSTNSLNARIGCATTDALAVTNANQVDFLGSWATVFMDYDDADALGNGRKIRLFRGLNGSVDQLTLTTDDAASGAVLNQSSDLSIGNEEGLGRTQDGLISIAGVRDTLWTTAEMLEITRLAEV